MDTIRFVLVITFVMVSMKLWSSWEATYGTAPQISTQESAAQEPSIQPDEMPVFTGTDNPAAQTPIISGVNNSSRSPVVKVETDVFNLEIELQGAGISKASLVDFPVSLEEPDTPFVLLEESPETVFVVQGGLLSDQSAPNQQSLYSSASDLYVMANGQDMLSVPFTWQENGISVTKTYEFARGSHLVKVNYSVSNNSSQPWQGRAYTQIKRNNPERSRMRFVYTYTGTVISTPENRYEKIPFEDIDESPLSQQNSDGWIAVIQHYFLAAIVPAKAEDNYHYYTRSLGNKLFTSGMISPANLVASGQSAQFTDQLYIGPFIYNC
jgi:YidC/Oxa1 family membrane protein insertase